MIKFFGSKDSLTSPTVQNFINLGAIPFCKTNVPQVKQSCLSNPQFWWRMDSKWMADIRGAQVYPSARISGYSAIRGLSAIHLPNYGNVQNTYTWFGWKEFHWKVQTPGVTSLGNVQHGVQQPAIWDDDQPTQPAARSRRLQWRWGLPHRWRWLHSRSRQWYWRLAEVRSLKEKIK